VMLPLRRDCCVDVPIATFSDVRFPCAAPRASSPFHAYASGMMENFKLYHSFPEDEIFPHLTFDSHSSFSCTVQIRLRRSTIHLISRSDVFRRLAWQERSFVRGYQSEMLMSMMIECDVECLVKSIKFPELTIAEGRLHVGAEFETHDAFDDDDVCFFGAAPHGRWRVHPSRCQVMCSI
jgi:hypothetical protein